MNFSADPIHQPSRRRFIALSTAAVAGSWVPGRLRAEEKPPYGMHLPATVSASAGLPLRDGQRAPFGWTTTTVTDATKPAVQLTWPKLGSGQVPTHFRIAVGLDERDEKLVEVALTKSGRVLGTLDIRFPAQFQIHEIPLKPADADAIRGEGLSLRVTKGSDLELLTGGEGLPAALQPHLLIPGTADPMDEFFRRLGTLACVQPFGWMEGCVLDGLLDLAEIPEHADLADAAARHLGLFFKGSELICEDVRSRPHDGRVYGIEGTLPFAALARTRPDAPQLEIALDLWNQRRLEDGTICDRHDLTTEGTYTIAYPLACIARARQSDSLLNDALFQCRVRQARLFDGRELWRTYSRGERTNRNWARGIAWQLLGLARTLRVAHGNVPTRDLEIHFERLAQWAIAMQREDGLWAVFADQPGLVPDSGGSAGLAAALAIGHREGWIGEHALAAARRTLNGVRSHLTPDGFLDGVAQANKGGEELQRGDYRVIYQMGMGLLAQLVAACEGGHR